jgi:hypothetical protein
MMICRTCFVQAMRCMLLAVVLAGLSREEGGMALPCRDRYRFVHTHL